MIKKISEYIGRHALLPAGGRVIVALSGGADSVALLHVLRGSGYTCMAVHCNFHLRGEESMRDERFVRQLCERTATPLDVIDFDTERYAAEKGVSIEMAARELRYAAFEKKLSEHRCVAIAVAHHRDDSAETLLLNLIRGTGIRGLHGIRPVNGNIVRPLLCVGRDDIERFLHDMGEEYVTDSTNLETDFTRNKIRLELLPMMAEINPSIRESLAATAERLAEAEAYYTRGVEQGKTNVLKNNRIDLAALRREPSPRTLLYEILSPLGFNGTQTDAMLGLSDCDSGRRFHGKGCTVASHGGSLYIYKEECDDFCDAILLPDEGGINTPQGVLTIKKALFNGEISKQRNVASLDADTLRTPLSVRKTRNGDRFIPFGMRGSKLVSDYLTDRKRNVVEKERQAVVVDADDNIVWLVNERPAAPYCVTERTKNVLCITLRPHHATDAEQRDECGL